MKRSEHLFQLIKSLSKSEKRSFKLFANRHVIGDKNNYIELFDAIDQQKEYDEPLLIKKLREPKIVNNLSSIKVQLYNLILKSLRQYNSTNKAVYEIRMYMDYIDIFFEKGLYDQCKKMILKAKEIAYQYDNYIVIDSLSIYEYEIAVKEASYKDIENYINVIYPEVKRVRKINEMSAEYEYLLASIKLLVLKNNRTGRTFDNEKFEKLIQHELLQEDPEKQPLKCQEDYHAIWGYYHFIMGNEEKTYYHRKKVLELLEAKPKEVMEFPKIWIYNARLLLIALGHFKMYDEFYEAQKRIKKFIDRIAKEKKTQNLNSEIYTTIYNTKLDFDIDRGYFKECSEYAKEAEEHFQKYVNQLDLNSKMVMYCNFCYAYFGNGEYHRSLFWVNKLLHKNYGNVRMDLQCIARILNIAIHYELGNYDIIFSLVRSTNRFLTKVERKFRVETTFLKFANKYLTQQYQTALSGAFQQEIDDLIRITQDPVERRTIEYFDIISWLKTKTEKRSMEEIIRETPKDKKLSKGIM